MEKRLTISRVQSGISYANGTVFSQQPANGTATKGSTVTIFVQNGQSASAPPSDTGSPTVNPSGPANGTGGILGL